MKYITVIKVTCDAGDVEDAYHTAGEYLRGKVDMGVDMTCKTSTLPGYWFKRYGFAGMLMLVVVSVLILVVTPLEGKEKKSFKNMDREFLVK